MRLIWLLPLSLAVLVAAWTLLHAQEPPPGDAAEPVGEGNWRRVTGTSKEGNLEEALRGAVREASDLVNRAGADRMVVWEVEKISGRQGGFAGFREVSVTIRFPEDPR
jgi:hypothetical protein